MCGLGLVWHKLCICPAHVGFVPLMGPEAQLHLAEMVDSDAATCRHIAQQCCGHKTVLCCVVLLREHTLLYVV